MVGVVHHGDEQVEKDDDVDHGEAAEHDEGPEAGKLLQRSMRGRVYNMFTPSFQKMRGSVYNMFTICLQYVYNMFTALPQEEDNC